VLDGVSDREWYIESLELIRTFDFDFVVPGIAPAGEPYYELVEKPEAEQRIDEILERLSGALAGRGPGGGGTSLFFVRLAP
jgi:hypothetical protein